MFDLSPGTLLSIASFTIVLGVALGSLMTVRRDSRYKITSEERDEYKARAERLAEDLRIARGQITELRQQPRIAVVTDKLDDLLGAVDDLRESIDVHANPGMERRRRQVEHAPRRRLSDHDAHDVCNRRSGG